MSILWFLVCCNCCAVWRRTKDLLL